MFQFKKNCPLKNWLLGPTLRNELRRLASLVQTFKRGSVQMTVIYSPVPEVRQSARYTLFYMA